MGYVLQGGSFTRTFSSVELETLSLKLLASQQSYFKTDGIAVILLSEKGYLLVMQVDGAGSYPARTLFGQYTFSFDSSYAHQIKLTSKSGLSEPATCDQALAAPGLQGDAQPTAPLGGGGNPRRKRKVIAGDLPCRGHELGEAVALFPYFLGGARKVARITHPVQLEAVEVVSGYELDEHPRF